MSASTPLTIVIAGSTHHTRQCAEVLSADPSFRITGIVTPSPKPIGRKQVITNNPLHTWAEEQKIPVVFVEKKIDEEVQQQLQTLQRPSLLLVVDFGYIVPQWLLDWPTVAPVNIHPSDLPRFRGSSPGQFALLFGETTSAVTLMVMDKQLDHGPIITKIGFTVDPTWTASSYYIHAFDLMTKELGKLLHEFVQHQSAVTPQPDVSPTPTAQQLTRDNGFVPFNTLKVLLQPHSKDQELEEIPFLSLYRISTTKHHLFDMWRGLTPWPGLWTIIPTNHGEKRMKLLEMAYENDQLTLQTLQIEGKTKQTATKAVLHSIGL